MTLSFSSVTPCLTSGGSAESFLKNSARAVTINFDANASPQVITQNADGSVGTSSADMILPTTSIVSGVTVSCSSLVVSVPVSA